MEKEGGKRGETLPGGGSGGALPRGLKDALEIFDDVVSKDGIFGGIFQMSKATDGKKLLALGIDASGAMEQRFLTRHGEHFVLISDKLEETSAKRANSPFGLKLLRENIGQTPSGQREKGGYHVCRRVDRGLQDDASDPRIIFI